MAKISCMLSYLYESYTLYYIKLSLYSVSLLLLLSLHTQPINMITQEDEPIPDVVEKSKAGEKRVKLEALKTGSKEREKSSDDVSPKAEKRIHIKGEALLIDRDSPSLESRGLLLKERSESLEKPYEGVLERSRSPEKSRSHDRKGVIEKTSFLEKTGSFEKTASVMEKTISKQLAEKVVLAKACERSPGKKTEKVSMERENEETDQEKKVVLVETATKEDSKVKVNKKDGELESAKIKEEVKEEMKEKQMDKEVEKQAADIVLKTMQKTMKQAEEKSSVTEEKLKEERRKEDVEKQAAEIVARAFTKSIEQEEGDVFIGSKGLKEEDYVREVLQGREKDIDVAEVEKQAADIVSKAIEEAVAMPIQQLLKSATEENTTEKNSAENVKKTSGISEEIETNSANAAVERKNVEEDKASVAVVDDLTSLLKKLPEGKLTLKDLPSSDDSSSFSSFESVKLAPHMVGPRAVVAQSSTESRDSMDGEKTQPTAPPSRPTRVESLVKRMSQEIEGNKEKGNGSSEGSGSTSSDDNSKGARPKVEGASKRPPPLRSKPPSGTRGNSLVKRLSQELEGQMADFPPPSPVTGTTFSREASIDCQPPPDTPAAVWTPMYGFSRSLSRESATGDRKRSVDSIKSLEAVKDVDESTLKSSRDSSFDSQKDAPIPATRGQLQKQPSGNSKNEDNSKESDIVTIENGTTPKVSPDVRSKEAGNKSDTSAKGEQPEKSSVRKIVPAKPPRQSSMESRGLLTKQGSIDNKTVTDKPTRQNSKDQEKSPTPPIQTQPRPPSPKKLPPPVAKKPTRPLSGDGTQSKDISNPTNQQVEMKSPTGAPQSSINSPTDPSNKPVPPAVLPKPKKSSKHAHSTTPPNIAQPAENSSENKEGTNKSIISESSDSPKDKEGEVNKGESGEEKKDSPEKEKAGNDVTTGRDSSSKEAAVANQSSALTVSTEVIVYKLVKTLYRYTLQPAFQFWQYSLISFPQFSVYFVS